MGYGYMLCDMGYGYMLLICIWVTDTVTGMDGLIQQLRVWVTDMYSYGHGLRIRLRKRYGYGRDTVTEEYKRYTQARHTL